MNLDWSESQELLRKTARDFFARESPPASVKLLEKTPARHDPVLWRKMADLGWLGLPFPEQYGGAGGAFLDLAALLEEMGRAAIVSPFLSSVVLSGDLLLKAGAEAQKQRLLPAIATGASIVTVALCEGDATYEAQDVQLAAERSAHGWTLTGTKLFVLDGMAADHFIIAARTKPGKGPAGISLFLVDASSPGITRTPLPSFGGEAQAEVRFENVAFPGDALLGPLDKGWPLVRAYLRRGALALCAQMVGGAQHALDLTVAYAKQRIQFGRPIGSFQAIQHKCADMATDVDTARYLTYYAAWKLDAKQQCALEISQAKAWLSDAYRRVAREAHQVHAGIAYVDDHDLHLYFRRAKASEVLFGDADYHLKEVASLLKL
jgi:alkylation response protein AidB-like acyl-CoA dehydrogenase